MKTGSTALSSRNAAGYLRQKLVERLRPTLTGPRQLVNLEIPPPLLSSFEASIPSLRPAAVLVPLIEHADGIRVQLTQRSHSLRNHPGQISFPGGGADSQDRDRVDTALREAQEEIGLDRTHVEVIGMLDDYPTITGYRVTPVVGLVDPQAAPVADGIEVTHLIEVPLPFVLDIGNYQRRSFLREGVEVFYYEITHGEHRIWGATAGMLRSFCELMG